MKLIQYMAFKTMQIYNYYPIKQYNINYYFKNSNSKISNAIKNNSYMSFQGNIDYSKIMLQTQKELNKLDKLRIREMNIPNFAFIEDNGMRGMSLSSSGNRKFLSRIKSCGVDTVIDLRDKYSSEKYPLLCKDLNLNYINIPIDSDKINPRTIIDNLPVLFDTTNHKNYYIACALGLHRTDIALALNYIFNPTKHAIPEMIGHQKDGKFVLEKIMRRINSIKNNLTEEDIKKLGFKNNFEQEFINRKREFVQFNTLKATENIHQ